MNGAEHGGGRTVWLASYPKSGNTWFRAVYTAARLGGDLDINDLAGGPIASARGVLDRHLGLPTGDLTADEIDALRPLVDDQLRPDEGVRVRKVHDSLTPTATGAPPMSTTVASALYLVRDPRDVAVSWSHHMDCSLEVAVARLGDPAMALSPERSGIGPQVRQHLGSWSDHVSSWVDQAGTTSPIPVAVVRYEDLMADPVATFGPALRQAGLDLDDTEVAAAVDRARFDRLRAQEDAEGFRERVGTNAPFFRAGSTGGWRTELPAELARRIEADHAEVMARLHYPPG